VRAQVCGVGIGLDFAEGYWRFRESAIGELDPIPRVFPSLVEQSLVRMALVLDETITVPDRCTSVGGRNQCLNCFALHFPPGSRAGSRRTPVRSLVRMQKCTLA
jgi:hypothetical protein